MRQQISGAHRVDEHGHPAGGRTIGVGIDINWQNGPVGKPVTDDVMQEIMDCPTPGYHETHHYCPSCPFTTDLGSDEPTGALIEGVIAAAIDRLRYYQEGDIPGGRGEFACRENALAITKLEEAIHWLEHRTADRQARGVEGTYQS